MREAVFRAVPRRRGTESATMPSAAAAQASHARRVPRDDDAATDPADRPSAAGVLRASSISNCVRASAMSRSRRCGSFCRHCVRSLCTLSGVDGGSPLQSGSRSTMAANVSVTVSRAKAARPESISYSTQPNAQISVRLSTDSPRACSGLM